MKNTTNHNNPTEDSVNEYTITSNENGIDLGTYRATSETAALDLLAEDRGYDDYADLADWLEKTTDEAREELTITSKEIVYTVGVGGTPPDTHVEYDTLEEAQSACLEMAQQQAAEESIDPDDVDLWGDDEDTGWGACPDGDDGAYWPNVFVAKR